MIKIHVRLVYRRVLSLLPIYCLVAYLPKKIDETFTLQRKQKVKRALLLTSSFIKLYSHSSK